MNQSTLVLVVFVLWRSTSAYAQETPSLTPTSLVAATATRSATATATVTRTISATASPTATATPLLLADVNCDGRGSAADFSAAIAVADSPGRFPSCPDADFFRGRSLADRDFLPLLNDIFASFAVPFTPTITPTRTITATPTISRTPTRIPTPTVTPRISPTPTRTRTATATVSPSATLTPTATFTNTQIPTRSPTRTLTFTPTRTPLPSVTRTPTGLAQQISGDWLVDWANPISGICFSPVGTEFSRLRDAIYRVTAVNGQLDIAIVDGPVLVRGAAIEPGGRVQFRYRAGSGITCQVDGVESEFVYDFQFTFNANGTGSASSHWTYGFNTHCFVCDNSDTASLRRAS